MLFDLGRTNHKACSCRESTLAFSHSLGRMRSKRVRFRQTKRIRAMRHQRELVEESLKLPAATCSPRFIRSGLAEVACAVQIFGPWRESAQARLIRLSFRDLSGRACPPFRSPGQVPEREPSPAVRLESILPVQRPRLTDATRRQSEKKRQRRLF